MKGFNCLLYVNNTPVAAQINAELVRSAQVSDITNYIQMQWKESTVSLNTWKVNCTGAFILNDQGISILENAFNQGEKVSVYLKSPLITYQGEGYIINFPIGSQYNKEMTYAITIQGTGPLNRI